jgi:hypothetical protein
MAEQRGAERVGAVEQILLARGQASPRDESPGAGLQLALDGLRSDD